MNRRSRVAVVSLLAAGLAAACADNGGAPDDGRLDARTVSAPGFMRDDLWSAPIPDDPALDPASQDMVGSVVRSSDAKPFVLAWQEWTIPVYQATAATPRVEVRITGRPPGAHYDPEFVHDQEWVFDDFPMPSGARPDRRADAHLSVLDVDRGCEYDLYGARHDEQSGWTAEWGNVLPMRTGDGVYRHGLSTRATGFAATAGLIWPAELRQGRIDHALAFAYPHTRGGGPVWPATASDGKTPAASAVPQGARLQLDPALDLDELDLTPTEHAIATAMQTYGMYVVDTGGAPAVYAVGEQSFATEQPYGMLDGDHLSGIPLDRLRVLALDPQQPRTPLAMDPGSCPDPRSN